MRHAGARNCWVELRRQDNGIKLVIRDDGRGGKLREGNGLRGMRERLSALDGNLYVDSGRDGTMLTAILPLAQAMAPGSEAVVVEGVLPETPRDEFVVASDLLMLVVASGRERTARQFDKLFAAAGLALVERVPLATGFSAFRLRRFLDV